MTVMVELEKVLAAINPLSSLNYMYDPCAIPASTEL